MNVAGVQTAVLQVGDPAPDFDLPALIGGVKKRFRLSDERGKRQIILAFYPFNWEPVSERQMMNYQVEREQFIARNAEVVAICVDSIMNTTAWERHIGPFDFPLCSDFWPHGEVSARYGVLRTGPPLAGASERALFVVDRHGAIAFRQRYGIDELPDVRQTLDILKAA
jgi:mycoredoxin-dependent peroxiredoxin